MCLKSLFRLFTTQLLLISLFQMSLDFIAKNFEKKLSSKIKYIVFNKNPELKDENNIILQYKHHK